jgi:hypothetical protein
MADSGRQIGARSFEGTYPFEAVRRTLGYAAAEAWLLVDYHLPKGEAGAAIIKMVRRRKRAVERGD